MIAPTKHTSPGSRQRLFFFFAALLLVSATACDGGCSKSGSKTVPDSSSARVKNMAEHLPGSTQVSFIVGDIEGMRTSLKKTRDTLGSDMPMSDLIEQQAKNELGIDIFDAKSWEKSGIAPKGGLSVSVVGTHPVMLTYINDTQKFEKSFTDQLKKSMSIEGMPKSVTVNDTKVKVVGSDDQTVAWAYNGKLVAVVFPEADDIKEYGSSEEVKSVKDLAAKLVSMDAKTSLSTQKGFKSFQDALANDQTMAAYISAKTVFNQGDIKSLAQGDASSKATLDWAQKNIDAFGIGVNINDNAIAVRGWASMPESSIEKAKAILSSPGDFPNDHFATSNTLAGLRLSFDMQKAWSFYTENILTKEQREQLNTRTSKMAEQTGFDVQKDLLANLTGNASVLLYGVDPNAVKAAGGNLLMAVRGAPMNTLAILVPIQFKDKASLNKVVNALVEKAGTMVERTKLDGGVEVLNVKAMGPTASRFFLKDSLLVYATKPLTDEAVVKYINGERDEKTLGDGSKLNLGKAFASDDDFNGLYLNFVRAYDHLSAQLGPAAPMVQKLEEASLTSKVGDKGAYVDLSIDLNPDAPKADKPAAKPSK